MMSITANEAWRRLSWLALLLNVGLENRWETIQRKAYGGLRSLHLPLCATEATQRAFPADAQAARGNIA